MSDASKRTSPAQPGLVRRHAQSRHDGALYRALPELRHDGRGAARGPADHRHRADRERPLAVQSPPSPSWPSACATASATRAASRSSSLPPDPGDRQAADGGARSQPRLSQPRRGAVRLPDRRRRADHGCDKTTPACLMGAATVDIPGDRALGRADARRLLQGRARGLRHGRVEGARGACCRQDRLRGIHRQGRGLDHERRALQHHGHRELDEFARRGAWHVAAGLRRDPRALPRARPDGVRERKAHRRHGARGFAPLQDPDAPGLRERDRRRLGAWRLHQLSAPHHRDRAPHRRRALGRGLGPHRLQHSAPRQSDAGGQVFGRGLPPRGRRAGGDERAARRPASSTARP